MELYTCKNTTKIRREMMPLQSHTSLFSNGRFSVSYNSKTKGENINEQIIGVTNCGNKLLTPTSKLYVSASILVARPIEDMTDEEVKETPHYITLNTIDEEKQELIYKCRCKTLSARDQNYLLSIGVYPFDQSHFEDGSVIKNGEL